MPGPRTGALLAVALVVASSRAGAAPDPEIAWLRATYPHPLAGVHFAALTPRLVAWVPPGGRLVAYLFTADEACTEVELFRHRVPRGSEEPGPQILVGGLRRPVEREDGGF